MAEMGQVVKAGFVSNINGLYFQKRFKNSGHPFYDAVCEKAAKIDKVLADIMVSKTQWKSNHMNMILSHFLFSQLNPINRGCIDKK